MATENYEVYYFQNGRWHVHARYEAEEREIAIEEAISVESKLGYPARVIRETFYADTNTTEETVTYQGTKAKKITDADTMFGPQSQGGTGPGAKGAGPQSGRATAKGGPQGAGRDAPQRGAGGSANRDRSAPARGGSPAKAQPKPIDPEKQRRRKKAKHAVVVLLTGALLSLFV
jgi:hypothetical protein